MDQDTIQEMVQVIAQYESNNFSAHDSKITLKEARAILKSMLVEYFHEQINGVRIAKMLHDLREEEEAKRQQMRQYQYVVHCPGDMSVGLFPFNDKITVVVESGNPGGDEGEFQQDMQQFLKDWFDTPHVEKVHE